MALAASDARQSAGSRRVPRVTVDGDVQRLHGILVDGSTARERVAPRRTVELDGDGTARRSLITVDNGPELQERPRPVAFAPRASRFSCEHLSTPTLSSICVGEQLLELGVLATSAAQLLRLRLTSTPAEASSRQAYSDCNADARRRHTSAFVARHRPRAGRG
jgi:hypothetical protein